MRINVSLSPNSKVCEITKVNENTYRVRVDAPATKGEANNRLIELLADYFKVPMYTVRVLKGLKSRKKIIDIDL